MAPTSTTLHLPNGHLVTVSPIFGGYAFKICDLNIHHSIFPPGWSITINTSNGDLDDEKSPLDEKEKIFGPAKSQIRRFVKPTLTHDILYISSISNPANSDFKPATSPTRQIAMMLWATLHWYFHLPGPNPHLSAGVSASIPEAGRPKGQWQISIKREGIFKGKNLLPKLERMGLIATEETGVGSALTEKGGQGWTKMFVSQRSFWQLDARIFLFTLSPTHASPFPGNTPFQSRPGSPNRASTSEHGLGMSMINANMLPPSTTSATTSTSVVITSPRPDGQPVANEAPSGLYSSFSPGPFASGSHLPTFYPPPPPHYIFTNSIRHPLRPKPPAQGTTFYTRYIPSVGQYLSFRTASLSPKAPLYRGPVSNLHSNNTSGNLTPSFLPPHSSVSKDFNSGAHTPRHSIVMANLQNQACDLDILHSWMNEPRVAAAWDCAGPVEKQEAFLTQALNDNHSFPVIGCWDGKPFGYFEIYWVREDPLGRFITGRESSHYDRGFHCLVGGDTPEFRGPNRVPVWMSALVHYCWLADNRTQRVLLEPRVDNARLIKYLEGVGFFKEKEIAFPHKQAALMKVVREGWQAPVL